MQKKANKRKKKKKRIKQDVFSNAAVLLRPEVDASEKEVLARNNFVTDANKIKFMMATDKYLEFQKFEPKESGKYSNAQVPLIKKHKNSQSAKANLNKDLKEIEELSQISEKKEEEGNNSFRPRIIIPANHKERKVVSNTDIELPKRHHLKDRLRHVIKSQKINRPFTKTKEDYIGRYPNSNYL